MDLTPYVAQLRSELAAVADAIGADAAAMAGRLVTAHEAATRLVLLKALSDAMAEITSELAPGSVEVRLRGLDPDFVVTAPPADTFDDLPEPHDAVPDAPAVPPNVAVGEENGATRTSLRLPAQLKTQAEQAAARDGVSLNAWLVRAVSGALEGGGRGGREDRPGPRKEARQEGGAKSITGWAR